MQAPLGCVYWAVAPFAPEPPFRLYAGEGASPVVVGETPKLIEAGGSEFTVLVSVKARPVLVIAGPGNPYNEVLALRMRRFSKLSEAEQVAVRSGEVGDLFYLDPDRITGLEEENAAIVTTSLRLPVSALDLARPCGQVSESELRMIHESLARVHQLDLRGLVMRQAQELVAALRDGD
jgi:hypothetical protein